MKFQPRRTLVAIAGVAIALGITGTSYTAIHASSGNSTYSVSNVAQAASDASMESPATASTENKVLSSDALAAPVADSAAAPVAQAQFIPASNAAPGPSGHFSLTGAATVNATYDSMAYHLPLNPPGPQATMVRWVYGMGVGPTNAQDGTMYILGHAWGQQKLVFNPISELAVATTNLNAPVGVAANGGGTVARYYSNALNGSRITMTDGAGNSRTWVIDTTYLIHKQDSINDTDLMNTGIRGRIAIITCAVRGNTDLDYNVIVLGHMI